MKRPRARNASERISGKTLALTNLDKVLWPDKGYTKGDLIAYYRDVARWLLPYLKDRPLTLVPGSGVRRAIGENTAGHPVWATSANSEEVHLVNREAFSGARGWAARS